MNTKRLPQLKLTKNRLQSRELLHYLHVCFMIKYRKKSGKVLLTQAVRRILLVFRSVHKDLQEHPTAVPSHCSPLVPLPPPTPLPPGGSAESLQDCCSASTDSKTLSIPSASLASPAKAPTTGRIPVSRKGPYPPFYQRSKHEKYWYSRHHASSSY